MIFWMLPLSVALSAVFAAIPDWDAHLARMTRAFFSFIRAFLLRTAGEDSVRLTPLLSLLFLAAIFCIIGGFAEAIFPLLSALLIAPLIDLPIPIRRALDVREALEDGECTNEEELAAYESRVMAAVSQLALRSAQRSLPLIGLCALFAPFHLAPAAAWTIYALHLLALDGFAVCQKADAALSRAGEKMMIFFIIPTAALCGTEMGMAARARKQGVQSVLLSAVGVDPRLRRGHRPVTGDISQSCLCVCVALTVCYLIIALPLHLLLA